MSEIEHKRKKAEQLEEGNQRSYVELREATDGRFSMDTGDLRRELFIQKLLEWGIITEEQKLDFDIEFHTKVENALLGAWKNFKQAQNRQKGQGGLSVVKKPSKLLDAHGRPIGG